MVIERTRSGVDTWIEQHKSPSVIGLCLDMGVNPGEIGDMVLKDDYEWLRYGVYRIMAIAESHLFESVTGLRDMLIRCEKIVGQQVEAEAYESLASWISNG